MTDSAGHPRTQPSSRILLGGVEADPFLIRPVEDGSELEPPRPRAKGRRGEPASATAVPPARTTCRIELWMTDAMVWFALAKYALDWSISLKELEERLPTHLSEQGSWRIRFLLVCAQAYSSSRPEVEVNELVRPMGSTPPEWILSSLTEVRREGIYLVLAGECQSVKVVGEGDTIAE
jgi:hypothetical protein